MINVPLVWSVSFTTTHTHTPKMHFKWKLSCVCWPFSVANPKLATLYPEPSGVTDQGYESNHYFDA